jgi:hypothetical protein
MENDAIKEEESTRILGHLMRVPAVSQHYIISLLSYFSDKFPQLIYFYIYC